MPRSLYAALALSLLLHLFLIASTGRLWPDFPQARIEFPMEANLVAMPAEPPPQAAPAPVSPPPRVRVPKPARAAVEPVASPPALAAEPPPEVTEPSPVVGPPPPPPPIVAPQPAPEPPPASVDAAEPVAPVPAEPPGTPPRVAVRMPPGQVEIHYAVQTENDFVAGRATYLWRTQDGRYYLTSTVEAVGLTSLFLSGRILQESEGTVDGYGLHPQQYRLRRNARKEDSAHFNWAENSLELGGDRGVHPLMPQSQDLLSFSFHLALTAREDEPGFTLWVTNGKRFRAYDFRNLGKEALPLRGRVAQTLHLQGSREGEGALDVWLDLGRSGLPVKIRTQDQKGTVLVLLLEDVAK